MKERPMPQENSAQQQLRRSAPKLAQLTDETLFGDIWNRPDLCKRDRSLITVAALMAMYRLERLPFHLRFALQNGFSREELTEAIMHLAFYSGWPTAASAIKLLDGMQETLTAPDHGA
jgi:4-carboxymuconolactone decarboxylase